jgi:N-methylhydantoinase A
MSWRIGVDIGGTFTDVALVDETSGAIGIAKVSTTPRDLAQGVIAALREALDRHQLGAGDVGFLSHATTVVTNALLEEKGARTALITTRGFRDLLELRRSARSSLYDLFQDPPSVLVPRHLRLEISERLDAQGAVVTPLAEDEIDGLIDFLAAHEIEAVAICFLYSFLDGAHERKVGERLRAALPGVPVFLSSEVLPEIREFERTSTTAVCAYVGPILASYLTRLEAATQDLGLPSLHVMASSGGVLEVDEVLTMPAMVVESGPAAGVIAAQHIGRELGLANLLSFDMGGTTAKASLIEGGRIETTSEYEVGGSGNASRWLHGTGHPIRVPVIDLAEVSAGGGSIAWIDPGGALRVGPRSAGAEPGPVCYGLGGAEPTVTDADLVLGYLDPAHLLGGALAVDIEAARRAIAEKVAGPLRVDVTEAALAILRVVNNAMAEALRIVSVERGHDAREFTLVAFGGAGPVHAAALAEELAVPRVVVPPIPGGFSALGLVATDLKRDYVRTFYTVLGRADLAALNTAYGEMEAGARQMLARSAVPEARWRIERQADLRYVRQAYELTVPVPSGTLGPDQLATVARAFHDRHRQTYGHDNPGEAVQLVNIRVTATGALEALSLAGACGGGGEVRPGRRTAYFRGFGAVECAVYRRDDLAAGRRIDGPAIIESMDSTIVLPPGWRASVDAKGFIVMEAQ